MQRRADLGRGAIQRQIEIDERRRVKVMILERDQQQHQTLFRCTVCVYLRNMQQKERYRVINFSSLSLSLSLHFRDNDATDPQSTSRRRTRPRRHLREPVGDLGDATILDQAVTRQIELVDGEPIVRLHGARELRDVVARQARVDEREARDARVVHQRRRDGGAQRRVGDEQRATPAIVGERVDERRERARIAQHDAERRRRQLEHAVARRRHAIDKVVQRVDDRRRRPLASPMARAQIHRQQRVAKINGRQRQLVDRLESLDRVQLGATEVATFKSTRIILRAQRHTTQHVQRNINGRHQNELTIDAELRVRTTNDFFGSYSGKRSYAAP
jgi:hypothetical protein